jgi:hypothetical protein
MVVGADIEVVKKIRADTENSKPMATSAGAIR